MTQVSNSFGWFLLVLPTKPLALWTCSVHVFGWFMGLQNRVAFLESFIREQVLKSFLDRTNSLELSAFRFSNSLYDSKKSRKLRVLISSFGVFSGPFLVLFFENSFFYFLKKFCPDVFRITVMVIALTMFVCVMSSSVGGSFRIFLDPCWCVISYFLRSVQYFFMKFLFRLLKTLWLLFMDLVQLSQSYRATMRRKLTFYQYKSQ